MQSQSVYVCKFGRKVTNNLADMQLMMQKNHVADRISVAREVFFMQIIMKHRFRCYKLLLENNITKLTK